MPTATRLPTRLHEAEDPGRAARQALLAALRERVALLDDTDAALAALIDAAVGRITAQLAAQPTDYALWVLPRLMDGIRRVADELALQAAAQSNDAIRTIWIIGVRAVDDPIAAADAAAPPPRVPPTPTVAAGAGGSITGSIRITGQVGASPAPPPATAGAPAPAPAMPPRLPTAGADITAGLGMPSARQVLAMQHLTTEKIKGATADMVRRINTELGMVVLGVQTPFQAMTKVAKILPDRGGSSIRAIVTHQLAQVFNTASFQSLVRQAERDPSIKKQWRRSGKIHSRANHDAADGQVQEVRLPFELLPGDGKGELVRIMYPVEPGAPLKETINCGCVALPWKATWKMRAPGRVPMTDAERARRDAPRPGAGKKKAPATPKAHQSPQARALAAFPAGRVTDVTGVPLQVDARLFGAELATAPLQRGRQDLSAYWAVQGIRRPTEVWQAEHVSMDTGEVLRTRRYVKRFSAGGQTWLGWAEVQYDPATDTWAGRRAWQAQPAGPALERLLADIRAGVRVWPRRG